MEPVNLSELLFQFKNTELAESAVVLLEDRDAQKLAAYWPYDGSLWEPPKSKMPEMATAIWEWLWTGVHFDELNIATRSGVPRNLASPKLILLISNRLIYPDHTLAKMTTKILQAELALRYDTRKR